MPRRAIPLALTLALTAAGAAVAAPSRPAPRPTVVVAVADSGVNPYHEAFYRPKNTAHPCTYVVGFTDCSIPALRLSVGKHKDYAKAVAADRDVWDAVVPHQWYWIPGTNIIGAVCESLFSDPRDVGAEPGRCILDDNGHGTGTASSVLSEAPDALLLIHEGSSSAADLATAPVVPDVQSHSWGPPAPLPLHVVDLALEDFSGEACEPERRPESLFFLSAGNEAPFPAILDCDHVGSDIHLVGGGYPGYWTPASWTTFDFASWFCRPVAVHTKTSGTDEHCGTSFSAPTAAGAVADALLRLRRQDRYTGRSTMKNVSRTVTRAAFEQAIEDAATYTPKAKYTSGTLCTDYVLCVVESTVYGRLAPLPPQAPHVFWGHGWLDSTVTGAIVSCARGGACPAKSAEARQWNDARHTARTATENKALVTPGPQRDAGTKRDAGEDRRSAIGIAPGREYTGMVEPFVLSGDQEDWYTFRAVAGQRISVAGGSYLHPSAPVDVSPAVGCWWLIAPDGAAIVGGPVAVALLDIECDSAGVNEPPKDVTAPTTGTYVLAYSAHNGLPRHDYRFTVTVAK